MICPKCNSPIHLRFEQYSAFWCETCDKKPVDVYEENEQLRSLVKDLVGALLDTIANLSCYCGLTDAERKDIIKAKEILARIPEDLK